MLSTSFVGPSFSIPYGTTPSLGLPSGGTSSSSGSSSSQTIRLNQNHLSPAATASMPASNTPDAVNFIHDLQKKTSAAQKALLDNCQSLLERTSQSAGLHSKMASVQTQIATAKETIARLRVSLANFQSQSATLYSQLAAVKRQPVQSQETSASYAQEKPLQAQLHAVQAQEVLARAALTSQEILLHPLKNEETLVQGRLNILKIEQDQLQTECQSRATQLNQLQAQLNSLPQTLLSTATQPSASPPLPSRSTSLTPTQSQPSVMTSNGEMDRLQNEQNRLLRLMLPENLPRRELNKITKKLRKVEEQMLDLEQNNKKLRTGTSSNSNT